MKAAILFVAALFGGIIGAVCWIMLTDPKSVDFVSFWAAGRMVLDGAGAQVWDIEAHRAVERSAVAGLLMPFSYPPTFALVLTPFGALPYGAAFTAWIAATGALFALAARAWMPARLALAQPSVLVNGFIGQNAFLTGGLFLAGTRLLASRPMLGGAVLGLLAIKPQLGLMLPVALLAGRQWMAIGAAALSAGLLLLAGLLALGAESYAAFFAMLSTFAGYVAASRWPWHELASVYGLMRDLGLASPAALAIHAAVAAAAAVLVWRAWREDRGGKVALLAAATLLVPPYLFTYDCVLLALPVAWLLIEARRPGLAALVWVLSLLPVGSVAGFYDLPNTLPLASMLAVAGAGFLDRSAAPEARPRLA